MTFQDLAYLLEVMCGLAIITVASWRRYWLLAIGYLLELPVDIQVLYRKVLRLAGAPLDPAPSPLSSINRILSVVSVVVITIAIIRLLNQLKGSRGLHANHKT